MDRILIMMAASAFQDAQTALYSAWQNAATPAALSFGLTLLEEPDQDAHNAMADLGRVQFLCPEKDAWRAMPDLWQGESYVLMAHPAMRFTRGWDKALIRQLAACRRHQRVRVPLVERLRAWVTPEDAPIQEQLPIRKDEPETAPADEPADAPVLTGYLPLRDDPLDAVCPVAADQMDETGTLTFRHGVPLRYVTASPRSPFLHPGFCFGPAGFFRAMAKAEEPLFLAAFREGWALYAPLTPVIRLVWNAPVSPVLLPPDGDLYEEFREVFGVDFPRLHLSPQSRRGMMTEALDFRMKVPLTVKIRHRLREWQQERRERSGKAPTPQCITLYTAEMPEETERWLRRLADLENLPLTAYVDPMLVRRIIEFLPNVRELKPRYLLELPEGTPQQIHALSKVAIMVNARDRELVPSHTVWMDPDCVQYPLYRATVFQWDVLCTDRIVIASVEGKPDPTMFVVPEARLLPLAREMEARCLTHLSQRGELPQEQEVWSLLIREHPDWFQLAVMPVERQLFTMLDTE